jgi:hypothetical protein
MKWRHDIQRNDTQHNDIQPNMCCTICHLLFTTMRSVVKLNILKLAIVMLSVVMLSVVMLSVTAPMKLLQLILNLEPSPIKLCNKSVPCLMFASKIRDRLSGAAHELTRKYYTWLKSLAGSNH